MSAAEESVDHLIKLIEGNKTQEVEQFIQNTSDDGRAICNTIGKKGFTPLQNAVFSSHTGIVSLLLTKEINVDLPLETTVRKGVDWYEQGSTALHIACSRRHNDIVLALLSAKATIDIVNGGAAQQTALHVAAEHGHLAHVQCLVEAGSNLLSVDQSGEQPIHKAAKNGHNPVVMYLITNGSHINLANIEGYTPLMMAVTEGHLKTTILLLENNADITCLDSDKNTPLSLTILRGQEDIIPLLLDNEVETNAQNTKGDTALHLACQLNQSDTVSLLLEVGVELNMQNELGRTALHMAALSNSHGIITQLLSSEVQKDILDNDGKVASECTTNPELATMITTGQILPAAPSRERTIIKMDSVLPHPQPPHPQPHNDLVQSPVTMPADPFQTANQVQPEYVESAEPNMMSPRIPFSPRIERTRHNTTSNSHRNLITRHKPGSINSTPELQPLQGSHENSAFHNQQQPLQYVSQQRTQQQQQQQQQFQHSIGVDKATVDILKQKIKGLESQILTLGLGDDKAVVLYRQYGKLNEEVKLAKQMVRDYLMQNARPLTPRMENNHGKSNCSSPMDLPAPRNGSNTPRESKSNNPNGRKFNPNFMVETVESLKSELQILRNKVKPTHLDKLNQYIGQVESMALAVITFAHVMAVTLVL